MRSLLYRSLLLGVLVSAVSLALAQEVQFLSPEPGTVRGNVTLKAEKPNPTDGWISYKIAPAGKEGDYVAAVISPFAYVWNTRERNAEGSLVYPDGDYVVTAEAYDPSGNMVASRKETLTVANEVPASEVTTPVLLRCSYPKALRVGFTADGTMRVTRPGSERRTFPYPLRLDAVVKAGWNVVCMSPTEGDSPAVVDDVLRSGYVQVLGSSGTRLRDVVTRTRLKVFPDGTVDLYDKSEEPFPLGEYYVKLPMRAVNVGDTWTSEVAVLPLPVAESRATVEAHNKLDGFEYVDGKVCARIVSTFKQEGQSVKVKVGGNEVDFKTSYECRRLSFFSLADKRFVGFFETSRHRIEVPYDMAETLYGIQTGQTQLAQGGTAMMGGPGMPGSGMMGRPGMMGSSMMGGPGMMRPGGSMGPGMMGPGMMGPGMMRPSGSNGSRSGMMGPGMMGPGMYGRGMQRGEEGARGEGGSESERGYPGDQASYTGRTDQAVTAQQAEQSAHIEQANGGDQGDREQRRRRSGPGMMGPGMMGPGMMRPGGSNGSRPGMMGGSGMMRGGSSMMGRPGMGMGSGMTGRPGMMGGSSMMGRPGMMGEPGMMGGPGMMGAQQPQIQVRLDIDAQLTITETAPITTAPKALQASHS